MESSMEMVTVRMSRGELSTPWGFDIVPPGIVTRVIGSSLADRAGLQNSDHVDEIQGEHTNNFERLNYLFNTARHEIDLVVLRDPTVATRIWHPTIIVENQEKQNQNYSTHNITSNSPSVKVSLEHRPLQSQQIPGFNTSAQPYQPELNNNQIINTEKSYNLPYINKAEQYLFEKGGLFGTDPKVMKARQQPSYMQSETLKLIQEQEKNGISRPQQHIKKPDTVYTKKETNISQNIPHCFICNRDIIGVMCKINEAVIHPECFQCSTCGTSLKNVGHHYIDEKFYCDIHGQQRRQLINSKNNNNNGKPAPPILSTMDRHPINPDLIVKTPPTAAHPTNIPEPPKGFYQPDVLTVKSLSPSQLPSKPPIDNFAKTNVFNESTYNPESINNGLKNMNIYENSYHHQRSIHQDQDGVKQHGQLMNSNNLIPFCEYCKQQIRGAYVLATGTTWCPEHFTCANPACNRRLLDTGFVEEKGKKYCEKCFETLIAPICNKCAMPITADCLTALQKQWHPECFACQHCLRPFGNAAFYLENGKPYCEQDWNKLFTTKCVSCKFPIEAGDRWVEAIGSAFHSNCFICTVCHTNLEGQSFYAKNGLPFCRIHA